MTPETTETPKAKPQLHAVLAVEGDLAGMSKKILEETRKTFSRADLFTGTIKTLKMNDESRANEESAGGDRHALATTVQARLDYTADAVTRYLDAYWQKERTNQDAVASVIVDGTAILEDVPVCVLLGLEKRLHELRAVYEVIPTLDQGIEWVEDSDAGKNIWKTKYPLVRAKTEKSLTVVSLAAATEHHPEQVQAMNREKNVGVFTTNTISGMMTSAQKSKLIGKVDQLIQAVKQAKTRANNTEVVEGGIGKKLFNFINS